MLRNLLALLLCLLAVIPQRVCACEAEHPDHAAPVSAPDHDHDGDSHDEMPADGPDHDHGGDPGDRECPCQCHVTPPVAVAAPRSGDDLVTGFELALADGLAEPLITIPSVLVPNPRLEPPPARLHSSVPLFLAVSRLLN